MRKLSALVNWISCKIGRHDFTMLRAVSYQSALCECHACNSLYVVKMEGDCKGAIMLWDKAKSFYEETFPHMNPKTNP